MDDNKTRENMDKWCQIVLNAARKDFIIIIVCLICLLVSLYSLYAVQSYQAAVNQYWLKQWDESGCFIKAHPSNIDFNVVGDYNS